MPRVSIIIPTLGRNDCLHDCKQSLYKQTYHDYEIIEITEEGPLAALRNKGARQAQGEYLVFIDDDVICQKSWLKSIVASFENTSIGGVSGPAVIREEFRKNRDIFRFQLLHELFTGFSKLPGHISRAGAWTTGATRPECSYYGTVEFLEACNMAVRKDVFWEVGGFDEAYKGVGDWSEPDLAFKIRRAGHQLWFSRNATLEHQPSRAGAFKKRRKDAGNRLANYLLFSKRWIRPCWQHSLYKWVLRVYYATQAFK